MTTILVATRSRDKFEEIQAAVPRDSGLHLIDLVDAHIPPAPAEEGIEVFSTFEENAMAKARYFHRLGAAHVLADDSGLCVDAIGGRPGVFSKRFSGRMDLSGRALDEANNAHLLSELSSTDGPRTAHYVCMLALVSSILGERTFKGEVGGEILREPRGSFGFGYDPLFYVAQFDRTFGEVSRQEKNSLSHRGRAVAAALPVLQELVRP